MKRIKLIPLSKNGTVNKGRYWAIVDNNDYEWLNEYNWFAIVVRRRPVGNYRRLVYAYRWEGGHHEYVKGGKIIAMSRQIKGFPEKKSVYFKNGNTLDYRRSNLSLEKPHLMYDSRKPRKNGKSKFRGVSWFADIGKWRVTFMNKELGVPKQITLGCTKTQKEGAQVYNNFVRGLMEKHNKELYLNKVY